MSKVVCRVAKIKSFSKIGKAGHHNHRLESEANRQHIDHNVSNYLLFGTTDLLSDCKERLNQADKNGNGKFRTNAVLAVEMILSASPEYFTSNERTQSWIEANVEFLKKEYGPNFVNAVVHLDEQTPHIHAIIIPIDDRNKLNCRCVLGGRATLKALQDKSYSAVKHLGIERGTPKDITGATHKTTKEWRREQLELKSEEKSFTKSIDKIPVIKHNITGFITVEKAHEYYTTEAKKAVKKTVAPKIKSLAFNNNELKDSELLARKAKKKAEEEKQYAEKIAQEEKDKALQAFEILDESTKLYNTNLKIAEQNANQYAIEFYSRPENKEKLKIAKKATFSTKIKLFENLRTELEKDFEKKFISKEDTEKQVEKLRKKILPPVKKNNGLSL